MNKFSYGYWHSRMLDDPEDALFTATEVTAPDYMPCLLQQGWGMPSKASKSIRSDQRNN